MRRYKMKSAAKKSLVGLAMFIGIFGTLTFSFLHPHRAYGVARTWDGGCGANTNWSCAANWSGDTVPAAADTLTFDNTSDNNSTIDSLFNATETIGSITINNGYDGTITQSTTIHITTTLTIHAGAYSASNQMLDMNGAFVMDGGTFTASSVSTTLAGAMTISGSPTYNHNSGTFTFDGATGATLSCNNVTFNLVTFTHTGANTKTISSNCSMPLGANPTVGGDGNADVTLNGTFTGSGTLTIGTSASNNLFTVNSTSPLSGFSALTAGSLTISAGTFTAPATMNVAGAFTLNSATTWDANGGTINFNGAVAASLSCGNESFNQVNFTHTGSNTKTVGSDCSLPLGNNPTVGGDGNADITLTGTLSGTGNLTIGTATSGNILTFNSTAVLSGLSGLSSGTTTVAGATLDFSAYSTFAINSAYSQTGGAVTMPTIGASFSSTFTVNTGSTFTASLGTTSFTSTFTINSGATFNANGGTVNFNGGASATLSCGDKSFNLVTFTHTSNPRTVSSDCSLPLGNNPSPTGPITLAGTLSGTGTLTLTGLIISSATASTSGFGTLDINGTFTMNSGSAFTAPAAMSVSSTFTINSASTFNNNGGTLTFDGTTAVSLSCGNAVFNLVVLAHTTNAKTVSSDCSLPLGSNPTPSGPVTLAGTLSGTGTLTTVGTFTVNSTGVLSGFSGLAVSALSMQGPTLDFSSYTTFTASSTYTQTGGSITLPTTGATLSNTVSINSGSTFTASSGTTNIAAGLTINSGATFNHNGGTVNFNGTSGTIACGNKPFNLVTVTNTGSTKTISSDCSLPLGNNPSMNSGGSVTLNGTLSGTGTLTTTGTFTIGSTGAFSGLSGLSSGTLTISSATVDFSSFTTFSVTTYSQTGGSITMPSAGATFSSTFTVNSGSTFTASSGTTNIAAGFTFNSGATFNANGGTVNFNGSSSTLSCGNAVFNLVTINNTAGVKTVSSDCSLPLGNNPTLSSGTGTVTLNGTLSGSGTLTSTNVLTINTGYVLSGFSGLSAHGLTVNATTANFGGYSFFEVVGSAFILGSSSTFTAPSGTASFSSTFTINSGATFNANGGTVNFNGSVSSVITCGSVTFNLVTFTHTGGTKTVSSDCTLPLGNNPSWGSGTSTGADITLSGILSGTGTLTGGPVGSQVDDLTISTPGTLSGFSGLVMNGTFTGTGAGLNVNLSSYSPVTFNRHFVLSSSAIFTAPTGTMTVSRDFTLNSGTTFNANGGTIAFNGDNGGTYSCNSTVFNAIQFTHTSGTKTINSDCNLPLGANPIAGAGGNTTLAGTLSGNGTLTTTGTFTQSSGSTLSGFTGINATNYTANAGTNNFGSYNTFDINGNFTVQGSGTFTATAANMTVGGNFTIESGSTFTHNSGTIILDGGDQTIQGTSFFNLNKTVASNATLTITAGNTETIAGVLTLKGTSASAILTIVSSSPGSFWNVDAQGNADIQYVNISDANNIGSAISLSLCDSVDSGHNNSITFTACSGGGSGGSTGSSTTSSTVSTAGSSSSSQVATSTNTTAEQEITPAPTTVDKSTDHQTIPNLNQANTAEKPSSKKTIWILSTVIIGFEVLFILLAFLLKRRHKETSEPPRSNDIISPTSKPSNPDKFIT